MSHARPSAAQNLRRHRRAQPRPNPSEPRSDRCLTRLASGGLSKDACYPPGQPVRPRQATNHTLSTGSAPQEPLCEIRRSVGSAVPRAVGEDSSGSGRNNVAYVDRTLACVDCGSEFIHSAADQEYYAQKGFVSDPKRCPSCRAARRSMREAGDNGGRDPHGSPREYFAVVCSRCGNQAQVPFRPNMDRPVYCSDCFRTVHAEKGA
jgi:CxxC-x17-CxxC domain-containing protein